MCVSLREKHPVQCPRWPRVALKVTIKNYPEFSAFIRACLCVVYVPLQRLTEAIRNLYILAKKLNDRRASFALAFLKYFENTWINGSFHPSTWNMFKHDGVTTNNSSDGYNFRLGNKKKICRHPNFFQFTETIIAELKNSSNEASMVDGGKSNLRRRGKVVRSIAMRERLMSDLLLGSTSLISFQQAIGGSLSRSHRADGATDDVKMEMEDVEPLNCNRRNMNFRVPSLEEIKVPLSLRHVPSILINPQTPSPSILSEPVQAGQKRKSDVSYSVAGANLKVKRRLLEIPTSMADTELLKHFPGIICKDDYRRFLGLSKKSKLSLDQGKFLRSRRLKELNLKLSAKVTPGDSSCMFQCSMLFWIRFRTFHPSKIMPPVTLNSAGRLFVMATSVS